MGIFVQTFMGVKLWIWLYFGLSIIILIGIGAYWYRERIRKVYYSLRFPEKLVKVFIHYPLGRYRVYYRIVPDDNLFTIDKKNYSYDDKAVIRDNDFFVTNKKNKQIIKVGGKEYDFNEECKIKGNDHRWMDIHYYFNNPNPLLFDFKKNKKIPEFSAKGLKEFKDNDLFVKLLTMKDQMVQGNIILILIIFNTLVCGFLLAKQMGWLE